MNAMWSTVFTVAVLALMLLVLSSADRGRNSGDGS